MFRYFSHLLLKILCLFISVFEPKNLINLKVDIWKPIELNKAKFENETKMISSVPAPSLILCSLLSSRTSTANVFCFQDGICQTFSISLCHGLFAVENEEILTCYSNINFEALPSIYRKASYHELLGCWWLTTQKLKWFGK
ncbi:hypothetical protein Avbf_15326 [Armadillidium vulgare]|nr:hypothetical protein Avbf_15326 [Armadillidium vulgare]